MCDSERAAKYHHPGRGQAPDMEVRPRLAKVGVTTEEIDLVIFTHLHWDHCSNMKMFENARFVVHRREYEFAIDPLPPYYRSYESPVLGIEPPFKGCSFDFTTGDEEVVDGISVFPTPGHCPGHQSVTIRTATGPITLAGDAILAFDNLEPDPERHMKFTPPARFTNVFEMWESLEKLVEPRRGLVLPSHDAKVLEQTCYG
jgi:glyoxylase-like metal-dependent hydrolase (beta-lactamase superfamily II)